MNCGNRYTAVSSEAWAKLREWAVLAGKGQLLFSGSVVLASLKAAVLVYCMPCHYHCSPARGSVAVVLSKIEEVSESYV